MIQIQLQESQASTKTKKVFHFFGDYTQKMINGKFEKKHVLKWLQKSPFTVNWIVTVESWNKLDEIQRSKIKIENRNFSVSQKIKNRKSRIENRTEF